ncbi:plasmid mobilization relaxosome protein MobC [Deltaproteobacteria bacterium OttesenSCG-928-K17]|nr:plasmid mobilization relaxosome protein MobC [Deltaproteobacteria bacterium OttesenSCG-928-K17]
MPRDFLLKIRVTSEEREAVQTAATEAGLTVSDYVRLRLAHQRARQTAAERDTLTHLARIGSNINQIARWANTHANRIDALDILMRLDGLQADIRKITEPTCT